MVRIRRAGCDESWSELFFEASNPAKIPSAFAARHYPNAYVKEQVSRSPWTPVWHKTAHHQVRISKSASPSPDLQVRISKSTAPTKLALQMR
jgi:hypothetical protein